MDQEAGDKPPRYGLLTGLAFSTGKCMRIRIRLTDSRCVECKRAMERGTSPRATGY